MTLPVAALRYPPRALRALDAPRRTAPHDESQGGPAGHLSRPGRRRQTRHRVLRAAPRPDRARAAGQLRYLGASRVVAVDDLQRGPHPRHRQAICEYRAAQGIDGPLFLGADTHAPVASRRRVTALEVFAANDVTVLVDARDGYTPTPAVSLAILTHNAAAGRPADGVVVTPSHNPPRRRRIQVQPAGRRTGRNRDHRLDPGPGQRAARRPA